MQFLGFDSLASGLTAQRLRMDVIAGNIANAETTRTPEGGPYRKKSVVFQEKLNDCLSLPGAAGQGKVSAGVTVAAIVESPDPVQMVYQPGHPDADARGYVAMPNVNIVHEMTDMISASRAYEANLQTMSLAKSMFNKTIDIISI